jgi:hypothetical protein
MLRFAAIMERNASTSPHEFHLALFTILQHPACNLEANAGLPNRVMPLKDGQSSRYTSIHHNAVQALKR